MEHFLEVLLGSVSQDIIAMCLAFAAGAMLYIVSGELIPEANSLYKGRMTALRKYSWILDWNCSSEAIKQKKGENRDFVINKVVKNFENVIINC